ncbi:MAG: NAD-dependent epimerase/dehydratase family protein [Pseudonocardiales bacterium]|nr:NAD-dependent epimerase/dehydratase family protein [Pseudonocardiales bacterium]
MRVLVTGAAGFVGYAVAALLVKHGHQVTGLTRSRASALPKGVQRLEGDLRTPETLSRAVTEVDAVCHLAEAPGGSSQRPPPKPSLRPIRLEGSDTAGVVGRTTDPSTPAHAG